MRRVAVLGDVHANAVALRAVLEDVAKEDLDSVVWTGDLSWGGQPTETLDLMRAVELPSRFVRGTAERALTELAASTRSDPTERERWMLAQHDADQLAFLASFVEQVSLDVEGLGPTLFCHGSPRSDNELLTAGTSPERITEATAGIAERRDAVRRARRSGVLGRARSGRRTALDRVLARGVLVAVRATDDPAAEAMIAELTSPSSPAELIEHAEGLQFSD